MPSDEGLSVRLSMKKWLFFGMLVAAHSGCDSVALEVDELHVIELEALTPYVPSDSEQIDLTLLAPSLSSDIRAFASSDQQPVLRSFDVEPFNLKSQSFSNDFEMSVKLEVLGAIEPGQGVDLFFDIENVHGYFQMYTHVEFY